MINFHISGRMLSGKYTLEIIWKLYELINEFYRI